MIASLGHRGPDARGFVDVDGMASLGHARLSIVDLSERAHQPMSDASGRFTLTYNGEIYNHRALRAELEGLGHRFRSESDTEVVVEAFAEWRLGALSRFDGMFALAIWDRREQELVLARDRFGEKPLYHASWKGSFAFASDLRALKHAPGFSERPASLVACNHFLALGYVLAPHTPHPDIRKLEPATYLVHRPGRPDVSETYWSYADAFRRRRSGRFHALAEELLCELDRAVAERVVADVPVGAFLSGGLDSSTVAALAKRHLPYELHTFSVGFDTASYDESGDARVVAGEIGTRHHELRIDAADGRRLVDEAMSIYDDPLADTSIVPTIALSRLAREHVKVVLGGDGADEVLAGYPTYRADQVRDVLSRLPRPVVRRVSALGPRVPEGSAKMSFGFRLRRLLRGLPMDHREAHYSWREILGPEERAELLHGAHAEDLEESDPLRTFERYYAEVRDLPLLAQHQYVDAKTWLADDILAKLDRATMAVSLEARLPFLGVRVAELAAGMSPRMKLGWRGKRVLREAARGVTPRRALEKPKAGFNAPIHEWLGSGADPYRTMTLRVAERALGIAGVAQPAAPAQRDRLA